MRAKLTVDCLADVLVLWLRYGPGFSDDCVAFDGIGRVLPEDCCRCCGVDGVGFDCLVDLLDSEPAARAGVRYDLKACIS